MNEILLTGPYLNSFSTSGDFCCLSIHLNIMTYMKYSIYIATVNRSHFQPHDIFACLGMLVFCILIHVNIIFFI